MALTTEEPLRTRADLRDQPWFTALVVVALVAAFAVIVVRVLHRDVVQGWAVLATCTAPAGSVPTAVSSTLDTSVCTAAPEAAAPSRGWPVVAAVVPASAGNSPTITRVRSGTSARTVTIEYRAGGSPADGEVIVFVEIPPTAVPSSPVTVTGVAAE